MKIMFSTIRETDNTQVLEKARFSKNNKVYSNPIEPAQDTVSFAGKINKNVVKTGIETAKTVANSLSTSTSGHRAPYNSELFNKEIVSLLTAGVGIYALNKAREEGKNPEVIIGGDTRQATQESLPVIKEILSKQGVDVHYIKDPVPTPLHALMAKEKGIDISILMTASHNPWTDGGYNLVTDEGAIAPTHVTEQVAKNVNAIASQGYYTTDVRKVGSVEEVYPYDMYKAKLNSYNLIDWNNIKESGLEIHYDGLKGTGNYVMPRLLKDYGINYNTVKSGEKEGPNPTKENLVELSQEVKQSAASLKVGLANDGDADRFGIVDENGKFVPAGDVIMLIGHHLSKNKGKTGSIIRSQATTSQLDLYAKNNGLNVIQTPVGFKFIGEDIIALREKGEDILVAGEESGGLTVNGHIPEKDGIIATLLIADLIATEKKPLSQILADVKNSLGTNFREESFSKKLTNEADKAVVMNRMKDIYNNALEGNTVFGNFEIDVNRTKANIEKMEEYKKGGDGVKLYFTDGSSVLVRKSGTEPKVKAYIETYNDKAEVADNNVVELRQELNNIFSI